MGFDCYGLNPQMNEEPHPRIHEILETYGKNGMLDWSSPIPKDVTEEYFKLTDERDEANPGSYFRNNVWWWRPLWNFVCNTCDDFLSEKDMEGGSYNDGRKISKTKAVKVGKRLSEKLADGTVDMVCRRYELAKARADVHNKKVQKNLDKITKECQDKHGKDLVPADYPEPFKTLWKETYDTKSWDSDYPFRKDNIEDFATFCLQSGGFEIC